LDNHDQTKLEIAAAAEEVARSFVGDGTDISRAISRAFEEFAEGIRQHVTRQNVDALLVMKQEYSEW